MRHHAIGRGGGTGVDQHVVALTQGGGVDLFAGQRVRKCSETGGALRLHPGQLVNRGCSAGARERLQRAPAQQQKYEHRHRVVVDRAGGDEGGPHARCERDGDAGCHRHVHADAAQAQITPGRAVKRRGGKQQHRHGEHEARQFQQQVDVGAHLTFRGEIGGEGVHHHLHHGEAGHKQTPERSALRAPLHCAVDAGGRRAHRPGAVARARDDSEDLVQAGVRGMPAHAHAVGCQVRLDCRDAGQGTHAQLDQAGAGTAMDALHRQYCLGG